MLQFDGKQAIQILERGEFRPDVIILDLNLPNLSGLGVLQAYQTDAPVIVFTSSANPHDRERALALGAKKYVIKPSHLGEYTRLVSQILRNWPKGDGPSCRASTV